MSGVSQEALDEAWAIIRKSTYPIWPAEAAELIAAGLAATRAPLEAELAQARAENARLREALSFVLTQDFIADRARFGGEHG